MKVFQVRIPDSLHKEVEAMAGEREETNACIIREAVEFRILAHALVKQGRVLVAEDPQTGNKVQLLIPGVTKAGI